MWETFVMFLLNILEAIVNLLPTWDFAGIGTQRINDLFRVVGKIESVFPLGDAVAALGFYIAFSTLFGLARPLMKWAKVD